MSLSMTDKQVVEQFVREKTADVLKNEVFQYLLTGLLDVLGGAGTITLHYEVYKRTKVLLRERGPFIA